jgi:hypothetical protein
MRLSHPRPCPLSGHPYGLSGRAAVWHASAGLVSSQQVTTGQGTVHPTAALPSNCQQVSHGSVVQLLVKQRLCPPEAEALSVGPEPVLHHTLNCSQDIWPKALWLRGQFAPNTLCVTNFLPHLPKMLGLQACTNHTQWHLSFLVSQHENCLLLYLKVPSTHQVWDFVVSFATGSWVPWVGHRNHTHLHMALDAKLVTERNRDHAKCSCEGSSSSNYVQPLEDAWPRPAVLTG